nr:uncharacterized protein LOC107449388 [Parasteatoda tepidariorum]
MNDRDRMTDRDRMNDRERDQQRGGSYSGRDDRYGGGGYGDRDGDRYGNGRYSGTYSNGNGSSDITCCRNERCDRSRLQQCRDSLARAVDNRAAGYQDSQKCRRLRDDFNCLLWQTSSCVSREERDRDNEIFRKSRDFISRNCDNYGRYTENSCYKSTDMKRCEDLLTNTRGGSNYDSCRSYISFKECMITELDRRCTREDELFQGAYLADKAQEMSWQCGAEGGRNSWGTFDRRNEYDRYDNNNPYDRQPYDSSPVHLEDEDAMCLARAQASVDQCKKNFDSRRREKDYETDYDTKNRISCCSVREYRNCLFDATRRYCQTERSRVVDSQLQGYRHLLTADTCLRVYDSECNSSSHSSISFVLLATCIAVLSALFSLHR